MSLGTLTIDIEARLAKLEQGMDKATRLIEQRNARIERTFAGASAAAAKLVGVIGALGVTAFARDVINGVDALNDFADATGTTVENASALEDIALRTGTAVESVTGAMVKFNQTLSAAKPGSDAARVFEKLGLDAKRLRELDPAEALLQTAQALANYADDGNKARVVQELFGKSVREVAPFLKDLAEAGKLNATVTSEQAKAAEDFNKAIFSLQKNLADLARSLLADVLPRISQFVRELTAGREAFGSFGSAFANLATEGTGPALTSLQNYQKKLADVRAEIEKARGGEFQLDFTGMGRNRLAELEQTEKRLKSFVTYYERLLGITNVQGGRGSIVPGLGRPSVGDTTAGGAAARAREAGAVSFGSGRQSLADALDRIESADEAKLQRLREELSELIRMVTRGADVPASAFTDVVDQITKLDPAARAAAEAQEEWNRAQDEGRRIFEDTRSPAERLAAELAKLQQLLDSGAISWDTYARAQDAAQQRYEDAAAKVPEQAKKTDEAARELGLTFASAFEDAIVGGEKLSDVLKALEKDIVRIVTRRLVTEPLADAVSGFVSGAAGSGGGFGALLASLFAGGFAAGGYIPAGRWGVVGERGPEVAYGGRTGMTVQPNGATVNITINGQAGASRQSQSQQAEMIGREVMLALNRNG